VPESASPPPPPQALKNITIADDQASERTHTFFDINIGNPETALQGSALIIPPGAAPPECAIATTASKKEHHGCPSEWHPDVHPRRNQ
jgi:hypothetical protein